jgi:hypothetical protein
MVFSPGKNLMSSWPLRMGELTGNSSSTDLPPFWGCTRVAVPTGEALAASIAARYNDYQPVKGKRVLVASSPPGIAGRVWDEWSPEAGNIAIRLPTPSHPQHSEQSLMPPKTQAPKGGVSMRRVTLLSDSGSTTTSSPVGAPPGRATRGIDTTPKDEPTRGCILAGPHKVGFERFQT